MNKLLKFKNAIAKKDKFDIGLSPIDDWINTGNAALNEIISGDMRLGIPVGRSSIFAGLQGSGKSFIVSNIAKNAQEKGYFVIYIDTERSISEGFIEKIGVSMDEEMFMPVNTAIIEEVIDFTSEVFKNFDKEDKILLVLDSLSNLQPERDISKFDKGEVSYGQGLREKMLKQLVTNVNSKIGGRNMAFVMTSHMYVAGQDVYGNPVLKPNIGEGTMFIPSVGVQMGKKPLKEGKQGLVGIRVESKTFKTRFNQLGKSCTFDLPWDKGMDFYDGALDVIASAGVIIQNAAWYSYTDKETGEVIKFQSKDFKNHAEKLMAYYAEAKGSITYTEDGESPQLEQQAEGDQQ